MRKCLLGLAIIGSAALLPQTTWAHELITDSTHRVGMVLHIEPDEAPTAGSKTHLEFIMQSLAISSATLRINDVSVPVTLSDGVVDVTYVFPAQGTYALQLEVSAPDSTRYSFTHSLEMSRGVGEAAKGRHDDVWAIVGLSAAGGGLLILMAVGWQQRRAIAARSRH